MLVGCQAVWLDGILAYTALQVRNAYFNLENNCHVILHICIENCEVFSEVPVTIQDRTTKPTNPWDSISMINRIRI